MSNTVTPANCDREQSEELGFSDTEIFERVPQRSRELLPGVQIGANFRKMGTF